MEFLRKPVVQLAGGAVLIASVLILYLVETDGWTNRRLAQDVPTLTSLLTSFTAGIIEGILNSSKMNCRVSAHTDGDLDSTD